MRTKRDRNIEEKVNDTGGNGFVKSVISFLKTFVIMFVILKLLFTYVILNAYVPSESMEPLLKEGYHMFATKYDRNDINRYDVVVFKYPDDESEYYVKRVIGLPGDCVEVKDGCVYVNSKKTEDSFIKEEMEAENLNFDVPEGCYFMMGDNRNESWDSRYWDNHFVTEDELVAKVKVVYYPLDRIRFIQNAFEQGEQNGK